MTRNAKDWRKFYGLGSASTLADAQRKYLQQYASLGTKDPKRAAASAALLYGLANHTNAIGYGLPMPFIESLESTIQHANTRADRQLVIERLLEKSSAKRSSQGSFKKPGLLERFKVKASGLLVSPANRAHKSLFLLRHLDMKNARRVKASSAFLRLAAQQYQNASASLPADFVYGLKSLLYGSANRVTKAELRDRVEKASKKYYDWKNRQTGANTSVRRITGRNASADKKVLNWMGERRVGRTNAANGQRRPPPASHISGTSYHTAGSHRSGTSSYHTAASHKSGTSASSAASYRTAQRSPHASVSRAVMRR